mmetsp:Transcript_36677/g.79881  ORF Transcript_36677/g.79881 Transcript_36677/m.79881 type:complete len:602 (-) Transcript_36677:18-1823(-)
MGKNKKRKRQQQQQQQQQQRHHKKLQQQLKSGDVGNPVISPSGGDNNDGAGGLSGSEVHGICPEDLLITVETLEALSSYCSRPTTSGVSGGEVADAGGAGGDDNHVAVGTSADSSSGHHQQQRPDLQSVLSQKRYKELRTALHPFVVASRAKYEPNATSSYQARVTSALQAGRWTDAYTALRGCIDLEVGETGSIKRGTVQRWVRLCDDCPHTNLKLKILRAVLSCSPRDDPKDGSNDGDDDKGLAGMNKHDPRRALLEHEQGEQKVEDGDVESDGDDDDDDGDDANEMNIIRSTEWRMPSREVAPVAAAAATSTEDGTEYASLSLDIDQIEVETVHHVPAAERKPPNHHELKIYATSPNTITMKRPSIKTKRHDIDLIPGQYGAFVLTNVLSESECKQIIQIAESKKMGYIPDHPTSSPTPTGIDTCEWLVDSSILDPIHERIMAHLNQTVHGEKVAGVNARWRLFRYGEERTYRPHIDGSWPGSGRDAKTGTYTSDAFNGDRRSRYTFLIYLNDGFEGGGTTFYLPAEDIRKKDGDGGGHGKSGIGFETVVVKPSCGSVLCFPQGNTASLLHEGSRVTGGGVKYVVRTDLLYHLASKTC